MLTRLRDSCWRERLWKSVTSITTAKSASMSFCLGTGVRSESVTRCLREKEPLCVSV
jgi:hypothetical protein